MLEQMVTSPTRGKHILDLFLTTNPTLVNKVSALPGLSDHEIMLLEVKSWSELIKQVHITFPFTKKSDWNQLKQSMRDLHTNLQLDHAITDSQTLWDDKFTSRLQQGIGKYIPTRGSAIKDRFPWINQEICRLMRKRDKLYRRRPRSGRHNGQKRFSNQSKRAGKDQESIQSSTTPDPGYQWESDNVTIRHHKQEPRGQPFLSRLPQGINKQTCVKA